MDAAKKLALMQNTYAVALAEMVNAYEKLHVLDSIVAQKKERQAQTAPYMNQQLGVESVQDVFNNLASVFGCANWSVEETADGYIATATACKLCALSKKMGGAIPCHGWCLDPMAAMVAAITNGKISSEHFKAECTLMDADCCKVIITAV